MVRTTAVTTTTATTIPTHTRPPVGMATFPETRWLNRKHSTATNVSPTEATSKDRSGHDATVGMKRRGPVARQSQRSTTRELGPMPLAPREDGRNDGDDEERSHDKPLECAATFVRIDAEDDLDPVFPEQGDNEQDRADARSYELEPVAPSRPGSHSDSSA